MEDTPGKLIRIERAEAVEIFEASPIQITGQSRSRLYEDGFVQATRMFVKDYDYVWAVFSPSENFDVKDVFVRTSGPDIHSGTATNRSGIMLDPNEPFCTGYYTESTVGCEACVIVRSLEIEELDYKALIDVPYGKVQEITIPKLDMG